MAAYFFDTTTGAENPGGFSSSGDDAWIAFTISASYSISSSFADSSSFAISSSRTLSSSFAISSSFSTSASFAISSSRALSSSFAISASWAPSTGGSISVGDEGVTQGTATYFNFTGAGVTATVAANTASISITGGGAGSTPGGANTTIQFNDAGAFSGSGNFTFNKTTNQATLSGSLAVSGSSILTGSLLIISGSIRMDDIADPASPPTDNLILYAKKVGGRMLPKIIGPSGVDTILQVGLSAIS